MVEASILNRWTVTTKLSYAAAYPYSRRLISLDRLIQIDLGMFCNGVYGLPYHCFVEWFLYFPWLPQCLPVIYVQAMSYRDSYIRGRYCWRQNWMMLNTLPMVWFRDVRYLSITLRAKAKQKYELIHTATWPLGIRCEADEFGQR